MSTAGRLPRPALRAWATEAGNDCFFYSFLRFLKKTQTTKHPQMPKIGLIFEKIVFENSFSPESKTIFRISFQYFEKKIVLTFWGSKQFLGIKTIFGNQIAGPDT